MSDLLLRSRETELIELMDDPACDPEALRRTYAHFRTINALVAGWRSVYKRRIRPSLSPDRVTTVLDLGCGGGDVARSLARWARADGLALEVTGVDPDPRAFAFASAHPADGVTFRQESSTVLVASGETFDVVVSNHVLHHLGTTDLDLFLADSWALARRLVVHDDIARSPVAYAAYSALTLPFARRGRPDATLIRDDGLLSVRRSYTRTELSRLAPEGWQVERQVPYRLLLVWEPSGVSTGGDSA